MYVQKIMRIAVTLDEDAALVEAAERLSDPETNLVIVRDRDGVMQGVVSKTDVVNRIRQCASTDCTRPVASAMTREIVFCRSGATIREAWNMMKERRLKHVPVADADGRPIGMLNAGAVMQVLLEETEQEEELLRDYVMCVGYH